MFKLYILKHIIFLKQNRYFNNNLEYKWVFFLKNINYKFFITEDYYLNKLNALY